MKKIFEALPYHRLDVPLWTAESLKYDSEILKHVGLEFGRADLALRMELVGRRSGGSRSILLRVTLPPTNRGRPK